jgi:hypothetical protein
MHCRLQRLAIRLVQGLTHSAIDDPVQFIDIDIDLSA